jgi:hypothetical protein
MPGRPDRDAANSEDAEHSRRRDASRIISGF